LSLALAFGPLPAGGDDNLIALKAAFVYKFTRFIDWPVAPADRPFIIAVIGDPAMHAALAALEEGSREVAGRPIRVRGSCDLDAADACQILFIGAAAEDRLADMVRRAAGRPVLLVGDTSGFAGRGVAIELFRKPDILGKREQLRFRIDPKALSGRGLTVSAQLYEVGEVLR
jgi:hypothetical protein